LIARGREELLELASENRKKVERFLATSGTRGLTLTEVARGAKLSESTVKRHLEKLISIGRVHVERHGPVNIYYWNGDEVYQKRVRLSESHVLYVDMMINPWGKPFIRIKERKNDRDVGAVIVDARSVDELVEILKDMKKRLPSYGASVSLRSPT